MSLSQTPDAAAVENRRRACIRAARERLEAFVASRADGAEAAARDAEDALHTAVSSGAGIDRVSAELDLSPRALRALVDGSVRLLSLHPDARVRAV